MGLDRGWSRHRGTVGNPQCRWAGGCTVDRLDARHRRQDVAECTADEGCEEGRLTPIVLVWYDSIFSICLLLIAQLMMGEWFKISQFTSHEPVITVFAICAGSIMAFTYNFVSFKFIQMTSSVTHAIAGNLKLFAVVVLPAMFIDHITSVTSWIGFVIFLAAALGYAILEQKNMRTPNQPATTAPTDKSAKGPSEETPLRKGEEKKGWF